MSKASIETDMRDYGLSYQQAEHDKEIRAKVIDEFAERLKAEFPMVEDEYGATTNLILNKKIDEIAEEMRGVE